MIKSLISVLTHTQNAPVEFCRRYQRTILTFWDFFIAFEQRRDEKRKDSMQLRFWNLNICIEKVDAKCGLAEMTLVMTLLSLARFFCLFFFNVRLHSRSFPLHTDWWKSDSLVDGEPQGNWRWNIKFQRRVASSPFFSRPATRAPRIARLAG